MSEIEEKEFEIVLSFLIDAKNEKAAKEEFINAFGSNIIDDCDSFEVFGWD